MFLKDYEKITICQIKNRHYLTNLGNWDTKSNFDMVFDFGKRFFFYLTI